MNKLQKAAKAGDTQALNEMVDFPALRESVKQNVRGAVAGVTGRRQNPLGVLGGILAGAVAGPVVDAVVTPQGVSALVEGVRPGERRESGARDGVRAPNLKVKRGYEGMDLFVVHFIDKDNGKERMALLLRRQGLIHWRLSGVRVPGVDSPS
jgi:hypothetical protein